MFITKEYLEKTTPVGVGVDWNTTRPWLEPAVINYIEPILGAYFVEKLKERYEDDDLTPADEKILKHIKPLQAWGVAKMVVFGASYKVKNKGVQKQFGEFSTSADAEEVRFLADEYLHNIKSYSAKLKKYAFNNSKDYPEFKDKRNKDSLVFAHCCKGTEENDYFSDSFLII